MLLDEGGDMTVLIKLAAVFIWLIVFGFGMSAVIFLERGLFSTEEWSYIADGIIVAMICSFLFHKLAKALWFLPERVSMENGASDIGAIYLPSEDYKSFFNSIRKMSTVIVSKGKIEKYEAEHILYFIEPYDLSSLEPIYRALYLTLKTSLEGNGFTKRDSEKIVKILVEILDLHS